MASIARSFSFAGGTLETTLAALAGWTRVVSLSDQSNQGDTLMGRSLPASSSQLTGGSIQACVIAIAPPGIVQKHCSALCSDELVAEALRKHV